jgi:hypothetical protein
MKHHETMITRKIWRASWMGDLPNRRVHVADMLLTNAREPFFFLHFSQIEAIPTISYFHRAQHGSAWLSMAQLSKR